jgi:hypothetical protein
MTSCVFWGAVCRGDLDASLAWDRIIAKRSRLPQKYILRLASSMPAPNPPVGSDASDYRSRLPFNEGIPVHELGDPDES